MASKIGVIIVFDIGWSSELGQTQNKNDFFESGKSIITRFIESKIFSSPCDEIGIILMGALITNNTLSNECQQSYKYINEAIQMQCSNWDMIRLIKGLNNESCNQSDWMNSIKISLNMINRNTDKKFKKIQIVLISSFKNKVCNDGYNNIVKNVQNMNIDFFVISTGFNETTYQSPAEIECKEIIKKFIGHTKGTICNMNEALVLLCAYHKKNQRSMPWNVQLDIGSNIKINLAAYIQVKEANVLNWKNYNKIRTKYFCADKELSVDEQIDMLTGYRYGGGHIPYNSKFISMQDAQKNTQKCLQCIGFTSMDFLKEEYFMGTGMWTVVVPFGNHNSSSEKKFVSLIQAIKKLNRALIARYVYRNGLKPKIVALFPIQNTDYDMNSIAYLNNASLTMVELIYKDNITAMVVPSLNSKKLKPSSDQSQAVYKFIDAMFLPNGNTEAPEYNIKNLVNPNVQHTYRAVTHRALNPEMPIPSFDSDLNKSISVVGKLCESAREPLNMIRSYFHLEKASANSNDQFFSKLNSRKNVQNVNITSEISTGNMSNIDTNQVDLKVISVGTVTPDEDFTALLNAGERFSVVCDEMCVAIESLAVKSIYGPNDKLGRALQIFRKEAILLGSKRYNEFIVQFKRLLGIQHRFDIWNDIIVREHLGLITSRECSSSTVTTEQGLEFYLLSNVHDSSTDGKVGVDDDGMDGLLDNM